MRKIYRGGVLVAIDGQPVAPDGTPLEARTSGGPFVLGDLPDHVSPITGEVLGGRRDRREHMRRHNVVDARDYQ